MIEQDVIESGRAALKQYVQEGLRGNAVYSGYKPRVAELAQVAEALPAAKVVVVSGSWCPDCRREVPKLARILDELPSGWQVELRGDDEQTRQTFEVRAIPTFIVQDAAGGAELGRIIESPSGNDGLEGDLLRIAQAAR